jgi:hypothetical protein
VTLTERAYASHQLLYFDVFDIAEAAYPEKKLTKRGRRSPRHSFLRPQASALCRDRQQLGIGSDRSGPATGPIPSTPGHRLVKRSKRVTKIVLVPGFVSQPFAAGWLRTTPFSP